MSQDTTRTMRDSMARHMQMQHHQQPTRMMTAQGRDSLIAQLLDSVNRVTDATIQRQLRDSVATLRTMNMSGNQGNMQMQSDSSMYRQNQTAAQQRQMTANQRRQATSDQRMRVQKGDNYNSNYNNNQSSQPPAANRP